MSYSLDLQARGTEYIELDPDATFALPDGEGDSLEFYNLVYRTLCAVMFNHASSGHPGGSISSGRFVASLLYRNTAIDQPPYFSKIVIGFWSAILKGIKAYGELAGNKKAAQITRDDLMSGSGRGGRPRWAVQ